MNYEEMNSVQEDQLIQEEISQQDTKRILFDEQLVFNSSQKQKVNMNQQNNFHNQLKNNENLKAETAQILNRILGQTDEFTIDEKSNIDSKDNIAVDDQSGKNPDLAQPSDKSMNQSMRKNDIEISIQREWNEVLEQYSEGISQTEKMTRKFDLNNKLIIPFNRYDYVQSIFNPIGKKDEEIIIVQICHPILKPHIVKDKPKNDNIDISDNDEFIPECPVCRSKFSNESDNQINAKNKCFYCNSDKSGNKVICRQHNQYICSSCCLEHYVRKSVMNKTSHCETFERNFLDSHKNSEINKINILDSNQKRIEELTNYANETQDSEAYANISLQNFANLVKIDSKNDQETQEPFNSNQIPESLPEHAIVTFCKKINGVYESYRMIQIDRPLLMKGKPDPTNIDFQILLHISEDKKEIFYFTYEKEKQKQVAIFNTLDIQDFDSREKVFEGPLEMEKKNIIKLISSQDLFDNIFNLNKQKNIESYTQSLPQLTIHKQKKFLIFNQEKQLHFFQINDEKKNVQKRLQIQNARLFLKFEEDDVIWIIRENKFVKAKWDSTQIYQEISESSFQEEFLLVPNKSLCKNFEQQYFELTEQIQSSLIMQGRVHKNNTRISLLFFGGCVFTFNLKPVENLVDENKWFGSSVNKEEQSNLDDNQSKFQIHRIQFIKKQGSNHFDAVWNNKETSKMTTSYEDNWSGYLYPLFEKNQNGVQDSKQILIEKIITEHKFKLQINSNVKEDLTIKAIYEYYNVKFEWKVDNTEYNFYGKFNKFNSNQIKGLYYLDKQLQGEFLIDKIETQKTLVIKFIHKRTNIDDEFRGTINLDSQNRITNKYFILGNKGKSSVYHFYPYFCPQLSSCFAFDSSIKNCQFSDVKVSENETKLYQIGSIVKLWYQNDKSYQLFEVDAYDLDEEVELTSKVEEYQAKQRKWLSFSCQIPLTFKEYYRQNGSLAVPNHILMPCLIKSLKTDFNIQESQQISFKGQLLIQNPKNQQNQLLFIKGPLVCYFKDNKENYPQKDHETDYKHRYLPQWPSLFSDDIWVQYPLVAYKTQLPMKNQIIIINLAQKNPQQIIDLQPFRFVKFLETGMNPMDYLSISNKNINTTIFFLVIDEQQNYRVMSYEVYPYSVNKMNEQISEIFQENPIINILRGSFQIKLETKEKKEQRDKKIINQNWIKRLSNEKIIAAAMLKYTKDRKNCQNVAVVLQLIDSIVYFNLTKTQEETPNELIELKLADFEMAQLKMQRANSEALYFVDRSKTKGDQINQLTLSEYELKSSIIKSIVGSHIIALQILPKVDKVQSKNLNNHELIYLDSQFCYTILKIECSQQTEKPKVTVMYQITGRENPTFEPNLEFLKQQPWPQIVGNKRGFSVLNDKQLLTLGTDSDIVCNDEFLFNFLGDENFMKKKEDENFCPTFLPAQNYFVNYFTQIPQMLKCLYEIRSSGQSKFNYLILQNSRFSRKIEYMRPDQLLAIQNQYYNLHNNCLICSSFVAIQNYFDDSTMIFNQSDQIYRKSLNFWQNKNEKHSIENYKNKSYFSCISTKSQGYEKQQFQLLEDLQCNQFQFYLENSNEQPQSHQNLIQQLKLNGKYSIIFDKLLFDCYSDQKLSIQICKNEEKEQNGETDKIKDLYDDDVKDLNFCYDDKLKVYKIKNKTEIDQQKNLNKPIQYVIQIDDEQDINVIEDFIITRNYFSFCFGNKIFSIHKKTLKESFEYKDHQGQQDSKLCFKKVVDEPQIKDDKVNYLEIKIETKVANFSSLFPKQLVYDEFRIDNVLNLVKNSEQVQNKSDLIQITTSNVAMIFDLHNQKEVDFIDFPDKFCHFQRFVPMGILPYQKSQKKLQFGQLQQNEDGTLFFQPKRNLKEEQNILFRTYCEFDLLDFSYLKKCCQENQSLNRIDFETTLAILDGKTFFQEFSEETQIMQLIYEQIKLQEIEQKQYKDSEGNQTDNILLRRLHRTLLLPVQNCEIENSDLRVSPTKIVPTEQKKDSQNILQQKLSDSQKQNQFERLLKLLMTSQEFKLSNVVKNTQEFKELINNKQQISSQFIENCSFKNNKTNLIQSLKWSPDQKIITFGSDSSQLNQQVIEEQVRIAQKKSSLIGKFYSMINCFVKDKNDDFLIPKDLQTTTVTVQIIDLSWLEGNPLNVFIIMNECSDLDLFGKHLLVVLLGQQDYTFQIVCKIFIPYLCYFGFSILYFSYYVPHTKPDSFLGNEEDSQGSWLRILLLILASYLLLKELNEIFHQLQHYFKQFWNWVFFLSLIFNMSIVILHATSYSNLPQSYLIQLTSFAILIQWFLLFYWMRMIEKLSFFVVMIVDAFNDIKYFFVSFVVVLCMIGNAYYVININKHNQYLQNKDPNQQLNDHYENLYSTQFNIPYLDSIFAQYRWVAGAADTSNYQEDPLIWVYFIISTVFINILFLNMLVGIMTDTYNKNSALRAQKALQQKSFFYSDLQRFISSNDNKFTQRYLYVVQPLNQDEQYDDNTIEIFKRCLQNSENVLTSLQEQKFNELQERVNFVQKNLSEKVDQIKEEIMQAINLNKVNN